MQGLSVVIGGSIDQSLRQTLDVLAKGLADAAINSARTSGAIDTLSAALIPLRQNLSQAQAALHAATNPADIARLQQQVYQYEQAIQHLNQTYGASSSAAQRLNGALSAGGQSVQRSTSNFTGLTRVIQDLPFGFVAISNNIEQLVPAAGSLGLIISAVTAAVTFANIGFGAWTRGLKSNGEEVKDVTERIKDFNKEQKKNNDETQQATSTAISQGILLQKYVDIARDQTRSIEERDTALLEANKILGEHGEKLTLVNINTAAVTTEINKYTAALVQQALAEKYADSLAGLQIQRTAAVKDLTKAQREYSEGVAYNQKLITQQGLGNVSIFDLFSLDKGNQKIADAQTFLNEVDKAIKGVTADFNTAADASVGLISDVGVKATKEKVGRIAEYLRKLQIDRDELYNGFADGDTNLRGYLEKDLKFLSDAVIELQKLKVPRESTIIQKILGDIDSETQSYLDVQIQELYDKLKKIKLPDTGLPPLPLEFKVVPRLLSDAQARASIEEMRKALEKSGQKVFANSGSGIDIFGNKKKGLLSDVKLLNDDEVQKNFEELRKNIENTASLLESTIDPLFDALFDSIVSGSGNAAEAIGKAAKQMVLNLAKAAAEAAVLSLILNAIFPGSGVTFSSLFSQLSGLPKFADGGIVTGPTVGLIGEAGPEVIFPLNKLGQFLKSSGSSSEVNVYGRLSGNDIVLQGQRTNNSRSRLVGSRSGRY